VRVLFDLLEQMQTRKQKNCSNDSIVKAILRKSISDPIPKTIEQRLEFMKCLGQFKKDLYSFLRKY